MVFCFAVMFAAFLYHFSWFVAFLTLLFFLFYFNRNIIRGRNFALAEMDRLEPSVFKRMFRMDRETFSEVVEKIKPFMRAKNLAKACNSSGAPVVLKTRLAVTLRWLAGASYLDLFLLLVSRALHSMMPMGCYDQRLR